MHEELRFKLRPEGSERVGWVKSRRENVPGGENSMYRALKDSPVLVLSWLGSPQWLPMTTAQQSPHSLPGQALLSDLSPSGLSTQPGGLFLSPNPVFPSLCLCPGAGVPTRLPFPLLSTCRNPSLGSSASEMEQAHSTPSVPPNAVITLDGAHGAAL